MKTLIVLSGGMDSATVLAHAKDANFDTHAVHFQYGSKHNARELIAAEALAKHYQVPLTLVNLPFVNSLFKSDLLQSGGDVPEGHYEDESMKRTVVPFRNGIMLSIAAGLAESLEAQTVMLGNHAGDHAIYPDCRAGFVQSMSRAIEVGTYARIQLVTPFLTITKTQIAERGKLLGVPYDLTWSCYKGGDKHCGKCGTCVERIEAFEKSGGSDPTLYEVQS
jgi:7-cyano-7-deazaguanine synthase